MMDSVVNMMDFALKMMDSVVNMMDFALKMMDFVLSSACCQVKLAPPIKTYQSLACTSI